MKTLEVQNLTKRFAPARREIEGAAQPAVNHVSFALENGEILALVGPSGCGKTTTLRLIAGLERPDSGSIFINGQLTASETCFIPPEQRGVGLVFQDHALFPHLTVFDNVAFGLQGRKRDEIESTVFDMLRLAGIDSLARRYPHALSGGERQRVALARALAPQPVLVLMDEPFSSLDADMRIEMREQVRDILKSRQATVVFVTHDQEEALFMGDRLAVFQRGQIEQIGAPEEIFHASATRFVAKFMGDSDFLPGSVSSNRIQTELGLLPQAVSLPTGTSVEVAVRADDIDFEPEESGNAIITARFFRGAFNVYRLQLHSGLILHAFKEHTCLLPVGARVRPRVSAGHPLVVFEKIKS